MGDKLFFDDIRLAPGGDWEQGGEWHVARTVTAALQILREHRDAGEPIKIASLDHDMGMSYNFPADWTLMPDGSYDCPNGCDLLAAMWAEQLWPAEMFVHSANPMGRENMRQFIAWKNQVPALTVPYTENGNTDKQLLYTMQWETIHDWEHQGWNAYGCNNGREPVMGLWEAQLERQLKLWEREDERRYKGDGTYGGGPRQR